MLRWLLTVCLVLTITYGQDTDAQLAEAYFTSGEFASSLELYQKCYKKDDKNFLYVRRIVECQDALEHPTDAAAFLDKHIKQHPADYLAECLKGVRLSRLGQGKEADKLFQGLFSSRIPTPEAFAKAIHFLADEKSYIYAADACIEARKRFKNPGLFAEELANLYRITGQPALCVREYLGIYFTDPLKINIVRTEILNAVKPDSKEVIEQELLDASQKHAADDGVRQLLLDFYLFTENYFEALVQCKATDKFYKEEGYRVLALVEVLKNNRQYEIAYKALDYVISTYPGTDNAGKAMLEKTIIAEKIAFEKMPVDTADIRNAVGAYDAFLDANGRKVKYIDAMYRKASLCALYLFDLDDAMAELTEMLALQLKNQDKARVLLLMGDIYLMRQDYATAAMKYDEVEKMFKDEQLGALAKLKFARLNYFKGDFEFAKARLQSIKDNTSNDISNDAIRLFLLIQDNTGLDSNTVALQRFAWAQLLVYQHRYVAAGTLLDSILFAFPNHTLTDDILWEKYQICMAGADIQGGLALLDRILEKHRTDILADDALFAKATLYQFHFNDLVKAKLLYLDLLKEFPGSLYVVEARKRVLAIKAACNC